MIIVAHRINTIKELKQVPKELGVEIDVRASGKKLILNHEPHQSGEELDKYLQKFNHRFIIFNIKEAGIEEEVIALAKKYGITDYFLLDVEYPFIFRATRNLGFRNIAVRFSEAEPLEFALAHKKMVDWIWVDTNTRLPLTPAVAKKLKPLKVVLVSPDRWRRPEDITTYKEYLKKNKITVDMVMVDRKLCQLWR